MIEAKVIADSYSPKGQRITTIEATHHRFVLAELNTHRVFSRNSASSRAIPIKKQIERVLENPAMPVAYKYNQAGMQAADFMSQADELRCMDLIVGLSRQAADVVRQLDEIGLHKQWANRYLEPWMWHKVIITSTEWQNFFDQRVSPLAQPEINDLAIAIEDAMLVSVDQPLSYREWHLPYITQEDRDLFPIDILIKLSAARCARVSYLNQDGKKDIYADLALYERLTTARPPHWSPLEHVATPWHKRFRKPKGNFDGWAQLRHNAQWQSTWKKQNLW